MISVIIPVYNLGKYIERTLNSVINQTYSNIEIIVVDDGSADNTANILDFFAFENSRIKVIHLPNGGVTSARLTGVKAAIGDWIGFVDGDDIVEPEMYETLLCNAIKYNANISHCGYQMVFDDGRINYFYNTGRIILQDNTTGIKDLLEGTIVEPGLWNKLFHKSLFQHLLHDDIMDKSIKINEDLLMNYYLFREAKKSVYEGKCPYHYIVRSSSVSRQKLNRSMIFDPIRVKKIILDDTIGEIQKDARKAYLGTCINVYNAIVCNEDNELEMEKREVRKLILDNKFYLDMVSSRIKLLGKLICYVPAIYPFVYRFYVKYFQKKKYS